jgi:ribosome-associated protein
MSRKPTKGYFVRGQFVAEGSELDLELKRELKGSTRHEQDRPEEAQRPPARAGRKPAHPAQRPDGNCANLPDKLIDALAEAKRITNFEGRRRQMQFIGKLMRKLDPEDTIAAARPRWTNSAKASAKANAGPAPGRAVARPPDRRRRRR